MNDTASESIKELNLISDIESRARTETKNPGARLRDARLEAKLSIEEVARKLYLTPTIIKHIEKDDFGKAPGMTFVRGYLRSYARLVAVNSDEIIEQFNRLGLIEEVVRKAPPIMMKKERSLFEKGFPWLTVAIVLFLFSLVFMWWHSQHAISDSTSLTPTLPANITASSTAATTTAAIKTAVIKTAVTPVISTTKNKNHANIELKFQNVGVVTSMSSATLKPKSLKPINSFKPLTSFLSNNLKSNVKPNLKDLNKLNDSNDSASSVKTPLNTLHSAKKVKKNSEPSTLQKSTEESGKVTLDIAKETLAKNAPKKKWRPFNQVKREDRRSYSFP